jgi:hypothetical protein
MPSSSGLRLRLRLRPRLLYTASVLVVSAFIGACMQQGEGDVCDPAAANGGNADCQNGYVCTQPSLLAPGTMGYRCCPGDLALGTGVCTLGQSMIPENSANPSNDAGADAADAADAEGGDADATTVDAADANPSDSSRDTAPQDGGSNGNGNATVEAGDSAPTE